MRRMRQAFTATTGMVMSGFFYSEPDSVALVHRCYGRVRLLSLWDGRRTRNVDGEIRMSLYSYKP